MCYSVLQTEDRINKTEESRAIQDFTAALMVYMEMTKAHGKCFSVNEKESGNYSGSQSRAVTKRAYPEFVLTYLEELNEREEVTQTENRIHHGAWSAAHQEIDSSSAEEVTVLSQRQVRDSPFKNTF
ncbi:doublecortin domain-containing protein 1 [Manacus vitellinus]|uniref:doublecortin domain-containing protein 1 n=1 Tax=Manacus vitellinus TaxID=328815 RepID=UPI00115D8901|nr:doublecortin domain-containing protein 1 [Manacus vitellinus]